MGPVQERPAPSRRVVTASLAMLLLVLTAGLVVGRPGRAVAWDNGVASTPPMGWNSYDSFNWSVTEADVRANADYMRDNLRQYGWRYIVVDWAWYYPGRHNNS